MYLVNKTEKMIILAEVLAGGDLRIPAKGTSTRFVPNKKILQKVFNNRKDLEIHAESGHEINIVTEIDPRFETLLVID